MIIGLTGPKQAGKNTVANIIEKHFGDKYEIEQWSFAGKLKQSAVAAITGEVLSEEEAIAFCDKLKKQDVKFKVKTDNSFVNENSYWLKFSGREFLQWYGTEAHRDIFGQDFWTDSVFNSIEQEHGNVDDQLHLITDCRFPNEAQGIKDRDGALVRILRDEMEPKGKVHASEVQLPMNIMDKCIVNNESLEILEVNAVAIINDLLGE